MLHRLTSWSFGHRWFVVVMWLAVLVAANVLGSLYGGENKQEFLSPGTDSKAAVELLQERFPDRAGDTVTVVVHDDAGADSTRDQVEPLLDRFGALAHVVGVVSPWTPEGAGSTLR